jgi:3-deoxy-D-manno-octulosonic-acid transferase
VTDRPAPGYRLAVRCARALAPLAARFDAKIARGLAGRAGLSQRLARWAATHRDPARPLVWFHAPSVGEGLQARAVIQLLRAEHPGWQIAYSFFSPSAERFAAGLAVDVTDYLPFDRPADVAAALDALRPAALVYAKLDVWPELTLAAHGRGVRTGLIAATVAPGSGRLRSPARRWLARAYAALDRVGAISAEDAGRLAQLGVRAVALRVTGDTRYDSVADRAARLDRAADPFARLGPAPPGGPTVVAGSTWPADEAVLLPAFALLAREAPAARLVIAPHEPNPDHLAGVAGRAAAAGLPRPVRLSQLTPGVAASVIVVDRVGVLADLYAAADVAFVGGGFHRAGLHSVLEPAVFGVPVTFGPQWAGSRDAGLLLAREAAVALPQRDAVRALLARWLVWHHDPAARRRAGDAARDVVMEGQGAAERTAAMVGELIERGTGNAERETAVQAS